MKVFLGADVNLRDYSGKKAINYLKVPENVENEINEQIPHWQRHCFTGMNLSIPVSDDVYDRIEIKMITSKLDNEVVRRRQSEQNTKIAATNDRKQRSKSAVFVDHKNAHSDGNSKTTKPSRKDSTRGLWKMPSMRKPKPPSVSTIEHPAVIASPQALPHIASGMSWKPAGPKS